MSHHIVEAAGLEYAYPDGTPALRGISFRIGHGESVGVVGGNGAGKSTLLWHLNACLFPAKGAVRIGEVPVSRSTAPEIRRHVGTIFQDADDQLFMPTVGEDVAFGPRNMRLPQDEVESRVRRALEAVNASHLSARPPHHLSGGEKRAAAIASVLAMSPDILAMDEPTSGLDPRGRRALIEILKGFAHTKIIASHDLEMILELCPRTLLLHEGRLVADGATRDILSDAAKMEAHGLEVPLSIRYGSLKSNVQGPKS